MTRDDILLIAKRMIEERGGSRIDDEEELLRFAVVLGNRVAAALRAALAQEQAEPSGYCTLEQLVVMQRTVPSPDKIAIYTAPPKADSAQEIDVYSYAALLATAIHAKHYKDIAPQWKPLDDLMGVLTQIDNMTAGLTRQPEPAQEPVAWAISYDGKTPYSLWTEGDGALLDLEVKRQGGTTCKLPLYTSSLASKPLTDEEIAEAVREADLDWQAGWTLDEHEPNRFTTLARAIERKVRGETE